MTNLHHKYKEEAKKWVSRIPQRGIKVGWQSPSNIALIKYWGKKGHQLPANASLSFTLQKAFSRTVLEARPKEDKGISLAFSFEGFVHVKFQERVKGYLESIKDYFPFLENLHLDIRSENSFPHSSGIASSASAFSALALSVCSLEKAIYNLDDGREFIKKASYMARLGSGSACRSVYGGYVEWGQYNDEPGFSDEYASPLAIPVHPSLARLHDAILITSGAQKKTSSTLGHSMMDQHPLAQARYEQANSNLSRLLRILPSGDFSEFANIVENEALSLHAMMMSQQEGIILTIPDTFEMIGRIRNFRNKSGERICFTLDAGPNIHLIYPAENRDVVLAFIKDELLELCEQGNWIDDEMGDGPVPIN
jgi:diphosphomevalonate decarboxylase